MALEARQGSTGQHPVTISANVPSARSIRPGSYRWLWFSVLASFLIIYCYPLTLPTPLLDPDEGLHAAISQGMVESNNYWVPRFLGQPFLDKPILYFAAQALSLRLFGMTETAVRLSGLLFALLGVATTALLALRLFDWATALVTSLVSLTSLVPLVLAQAAVHDVALVPWTNLILLCWWEADRGTSLRRGILFTVAAASCIALALLTKGLIGIAVISIGYGLFVVLGRRLSLALSMRFVAGLLLGGLLASPWFVAMEFSAPGYLHYYFIERHIGGFTTSGQRHGGELWYYYVPILVGGSLPWILYLGHGQWQTWVDYRHGNNKDLRAVTLLFCWLIGGLLFLSIASSKLITYALPLFPAISILAGRSLKRFMDREMSANVESSYPGLFYLICASGFVFPVVALFVFNHLVRSSSPATAYLVTCLASVSMAVAIFLMRQGRRHTSVAIGSLWFSIVFFSAMTWPVQETAARHSQRTLGQQLAERPELPDKIVFVGSRIASAVFYMTRDQRQRLRPGQLIEAECYELDAWQQIPQDTLLVIKNKAITELHNPTIKRIVQTSKSNGTYHIVEPGTVLALDGTSVRTSVR